MSTLKTINLQHPTGANANIVLDNAGNVLVGPSSIGSFVSNKTVLFGDNGVCIAKYFTNVANTANADMTYDTSTGNSIFGILSVAVQQANNANIYSMANYTILARDTNSQITSLSSLSGTSGRTFAVLTPATGTIRVNNTSGGTCNVSVNFFGMRGF